MAETTGISWCDSTVNFWLGCHEVGPGCDNCYARQLVERRFHRAEWGPKTPRVQTSSALRRKPFTWQRQAEAFRAEHDRNRIVFVNSLSDVFDNQAPDEWRTEVFSTIDRCPDLNFYLVTKRIGNALKMLPDRWHFPYTAPLPNLIVLATVVTAAEWQRDQWKLMDLRARGVRVGLSMEPLIEGFDLGSHSGMLDIVIVGGESRQGGVPPRPMPTEWPAALMAECDFFGVPFHMKQMADDAPIPAHLLRRDFPRGWGPQQTRLAA